MRLLHRPTRAGGAAVLGLATIALTGAFAASGAQASTAPAAVSPTLIPLSGSLPATTDPQTGAFTASSMSVEVALAPRDEAGLSAELKAVYTQGNAQYGRFLAEGQFDARYAPTTATTNGVAAYLRSAGLTVSSTNSPFLIRATGSSAKITAAFHTDLRTYRDRQGAKYYSNSSSVRLPASIASAISGVVGLTNTVRLQSLAVRPAAASKAGSKSSSSAASCETGYVTTADLFDRRPRLQRPDPVADQLHVRCTRRQPEHRGGRRHRGRLRALRLPGVGHRHLGDALLREALYRAA
jgi:subtilase family serine protease